MKTRPLPYTRTPAALLPPLPRNVVQQRNRTLIAQCREIADAAWRRFIERQVEVLVEEPQAGLHGEAGIVWTGHGPAYQIVELTVPASHFLARQELSGCMLTARLREYAAGKFSATLV